MAHPRRLLRTVADARLARPVHAAADAPLPRSVHTSTAPRPSPPTVDPPAASPASPTSPDSIPPRTTIVPDRSVRYGSVPAAASISSALAVGCP